MPKVYGDEPRPWIIADGISPDDEAGRALLRVSQQVVVLDPDLDFEGQVRAADFDAYVVVGDAFSSLDDHLHVLQFGGSGDTDDHELVRGTSRYRGGFEVLEMGLAGRLDGPSDLAPPEAAELAERTLLHHLLAKRPRQFLEFSNPSAPDATSEITHFVAEHEGQPCAGSWRRPGGDSEWWWLPEDAPEPEKWISAAFAAWSRRDSVRFPPRVSWADNPLWMTASERAAQTAVLEQRERIAQVRLEMEAELHQLEALRDAASLAADAAERRLLTAQSDDLVDEVTVSLRELGFSVVKPTTVPREGATSLRISKSRMPDG